MLLSATDYDYGSRADDNNVVGHDYDCAGADVSLLLEVYQYVRGYAGVYRRYGSLQWMLSGSIS